MGCTDPTAPPRRLHLSLPEDDLVAFHELTQCELLIAPDHDLGVVVMTLREPSRQPIEVVLGTGAVVEVVMKLVGVVARLRERQTG